MSWLLVQLLAFSPGSFVPNFLKLDVVIACRFIASRVGPVGLSDSYGTKNPLTAFNILFASFSVESA